MPTGEITMALTNGPDDIQHATDIGIETVTMRRKRTCYNANRKRNHEIAVYRCVDRTRVLCCVHMEDPRKSLAPTHGARHMEEKQAQSHGGCGGPTLTTNFSLLTLRQ
ncbi:hypothetical protein MHYP_G00132430 [Metynnis hypsauchen]